MDQQVKRRLKFDEFEKLLGEIPNVTSANPHVEESTKQQNNNNNMKILNKIERSSTKRVQSQPLNSAFAQLSFDYELNLQEASNNSPLSTRKSFQNPSISLDGKFLNGGLRKQRSNTATSPLMVAPHCGLYEFNNGTKLGQETLNLSKFNPEQLQGCQVTYCQPIETFRSAVPVLPHSIHGAFQILTNVPAPGMHIPILSDSDHEQHLFLDAQSRLPYLQPQHDNQQHQICWRNMVEEEYYRMPQRYPCSRQLQNHRLDLEGQHLLQKNSNVLCGRQPHFEVPFTHQLERFWDNHAITMGLHQSNPAFFSKDYNYNVMKALEKAGRQNFPEKVPTSISHRDLIKFASVGMEESFAQNGKVHSNARNLSSLSAGSFMLDNLNRDNADIRNNDPKPLPQKHYSLDDVSGRIYLMAKDQNGCRFLQRKFAEGTQKDTEKIFVEIIDHIIELMTDPFGNYLIQKLLEVCNEDQRMQILHSVTRKSVELVRISCDMHGFVLSVSLLHCA